MTATRIHMCCVKLPDVSTEAYCNILTLFHASSNRQQAQGRHNLCETFSYRKLCKNFSAHYSSEEIVPFCLINPPVSLSFLLWPFLNCSFHALLRIKCHIHIWECCFVSESILHILTIYGFILMRFCVRSQKIFLHFYGDVIKIKLFLGFKHSK